MWSTSCAADPAGSAAGDRVAAVRVTAAESSDDTTVTSTSASANATDSTSSSTSSTRSSSSSSSSSSAGTSRAVVSVDGGTFVLSGRDGRRGLTEREVRDGWTLEVVTEAPDELVLRLVPASASPSGDAIGTNTTVVVRLTPTGIETHTTSRSTTGAG